MNKKNIIIGVFILIILILIIFLFFPKQLSIDPGIDIVVNNSYLEMKDSILSENSILAGCVAATNNNISICEKLTTEEKITSCKNDYRFYSILTSYLDNKCDSLQQNDRFVCEALNSQTCDTLSGIEKSMCQLVLTKNLDMCPQEINVSTCQTIISEFWAMKNNDINECNKIQRLYAKEQCKAFVLRDCSVINEIAKDLSYYELASTTKNNAICSRIKFDVIRNQCYLRPYSEARI